jgi:hypothetical protein
VSHFVILIQNQGRKKQRRRGKKPLKRLMSDKYFLSSDFEEVVSYITIVSTGE